MNEPPIPHDDGSKFMRWVRAAHIRLYRRLKLVGGPGIRIQDTSDGQIISAVALPVIIPKTKGLTVTLMQVISDPSTTADYKDYIICRPPTGKADGSDDVKVAKPIFLRIRPSLTLYPDFIIYPPYVASSVPQIAAMYPDQHYLFVVKSPEGGTGSINAPDYLDTNQDGRSWAQKKAVCINNVPKQQYFVCSLPF